jgi:hypothetical protein
VLAAVFQMSIDAMVNSIMIGILRFYKLTLSPLLGSQCRFTPSCSAYAISAFEKYGFFRALLLVARRLLRCHPFHPGGYDPL